jgi:dTDP-glucose 4,6-dehydratase
VIGGESERTNLQVIREICGVLNELSPMPEGGFEKLITFVPDRPGHDRRYAIDPSKIKRDLGWKPSRNFSDGLRETVEWYLKNREWSEEILSQKYKLSRIGMGNRTLNDPNHGISTDSK